MSSKANRRLSKGQSHIDPELANLPLHELLDRTSSNGANDDLPAYSVTPKDMPLPSRSPPPGFTPALPFTTLQLSNEPPVFPNADVCLAHLKLLYAFRNLKEDIGYTDGLWGITDPDPTENPDPRLLSRLREKRWAIYLARAVDRYETWWNTYEGRRLDMTDLEMKSTTAYEMFPFQVDPVGMRWDEVQLMPLDILLVWHSHMLNPRSFLEDCMRAGMRGFWSTGLPWKLINDAINEDFTYSVSDEAKKAWTARTNRPWDNVDEPATKIIQCPACRGRCSVPWTSWRADLRDPSDADFEGRGYGDGRLFLWCPNEQCGMALTKDRLCLGRFVDDVRRTLLDGSPMPGTLLKLESGLPVASVPGKPALHAFPSYLVRDSMRPLFVDLFTAPGPGVSVRSRDQPEDFGVVREAFGARLANIAEVSRIAGTPSTGANIARRYLPREGRMAVRKMLSRYNNNCSPFALDLVGAILRQGLFIDKMHKIDWLHSPSARSTMERLTVKYNRFLELMGRFRRKMCVPTLDIDLAWHTAQLSPSTYFATVILKCYRFVNHDDKIESATLQGGFEWTSKAYQKRFGEVYSECTCWYCETLRSSHISSFGSSLGMSSQERIADRFHQSGAARFCPSDKSAHISAHNSVRTSVSASAEARFNKELGRQFLKAQKRAAQKGRSIPSKREYHDHWGTTYLLYGPYVYPMYFYPPMYYGGCPAGGSTSGGGGGGCAPGTCSEGMANGGCGGPGGCGSCGTDGGEGSAVACGSCGAGGDTGGGGGGDGGGGDGGGGGGCGGCGGCGG